MPCFTAVPDARFAGCRRCFRLYSLLSLALLALLACVFTSLLLSAASSLETALSAIVLERCDYEPNTSSQKSLLQQLPQACNTFSQLYALSMQLL